MDGLVGKDGTKRIRALPLVPAILAAFSYNPESGVLFKYGMPVGCPNDGRGYLRVTFKGTALYVHRIIFVIINGCWPRYVDHVDLDKRNNKFINLRECSKTENQGNRIKRSDNKSGHKGIHWDDDRQRWRVQVKKNGVLHMKRFVILSDAIEFHRQKSLELYGEFARVA